jgi:RimJ/RimL family protein N-acetyltransferase
MIEIREPFPDWAWALAWGWVEKRRIQIADDFFPLTLGAFVETSVGTYARTFGLWKDNSLSGAIAFRQDSPCVATAHILLSKRLWGIAASDLREAARMMFESQPVLIRIQAFVPAWNRLGIALALRIGGTVEGTMRGATMRRGLPADAVVVGITRGEFYGTELRGRIEPGDNEQHEQRQPDQHVLVAAVQSAEPAGDQLVERSVSSERRDVVTGSDGGRNRRGRSDQQDIERVDKPRKPVPRPARVRVKRADRTDDAPKRTGKRKPDRK